MTGKSATTDSATRSCFLVFDTPDHQSVRRLISSGWDDAVLFVVTDEADS